MRHVDAGFRRASCGAAVASQGELVERAAMSECNLCREIFGLEPVEEDPLAEVDFRARVLALVTAALGLIPTEDRMALATMAAIASCESEARRKAAGR